MDNMKLFTPGPVQIPHQVYQSIRTMHHRTKEFDKMINLIRSKLNLVLSLGDNYTTVFFTSTGTGVCECVVSSIVPLYKSLFLSNGHFGDRLIDIAKVYSNDIHIYKSDIYKTYDYDKIEEVVKDIRPDYVFFVHHETRTCLLNDVDRLSEIVKRNGAKLIVDCISSIIAEDIDIIKNDIDLIIHSSAKAIRSLPGVGFVTGKISSLEELNGSRRSYYFNLKDEYISQIKKGGFRFAQSPQLYSALNVSLDILNSEGVIQRRKQIRENIEIFRKWVRQNNLKPLVPYEISSSSSSTVLSPIPYSKLSELLQDRGYVISYGEPYVENQFQVSMLGDIARQDIEDLISNLHNIHKEYKAQM